MRGYDMDDSMESGTWCLGMMTLITHHERLLRRHSSCRLLAILSTVGGNCELVSFLRFCLEIQSV